MVSHLCLFEDTFSDRLLPLSYFRPVYNLKCGILSLKEKVMRAFPQVSLALHCRPYIADYMRVRYPSARVNDLERADYLFVNGRLLIDSEIAKVLSSDSDSECVYMRGGELVAARIHAANLHRAGTLLQGLIPSDAFAGLPKTDVNATLIAYPWELVNQNEPQLEADFAMIAGRRKRRSKKHPRLPGVHVLGQDNVIFEDGASINSGTVVNGEDGPVHIGRNARVFPNAVIIGPVHVGDGAWIKAGAQIYGGTSIGPLCKIGGEVAGSIFQGYANKQHGGFLGHSYIGAWVNLGAGTTTSDLKNNYGPVRVTLGTEQINTGLQFVGLIMGDHSKSAINSMFNTGTVVGVSSNIFGAGFPPKYVPSFSWGAAGETFTTFTVDKAIVVARRVMERRNVQLTAQEEQLFKAIFDFTSAERRRQGMPQ
ncbi:MAG: GlmU family protein [Ignavibacteriales bacterium]|nr:GlmU family protein [Ignavibacteriales bacterium]